MNKNASLGNNLSETFSSVEILCRTKDALRKRGWFKGNLVEPNTAGEGAVCLIGAMNVAMRGNPFDCNQSVLNTESIALDAIRKVTGIDSIVEWNDAPVRTIDQVYQTIDQTVETLSQ